MNVFILQVQFFNVVLGGLCIFDDNTDCPLTIIRKAAANKKTNAVLSRFYKWTSPAAQVANCVHKLSPKMDAHECSFVLCTGQHSQCDWCYQSKQQQDDGNKESF